ncbi:MAG: hypothetical protein ACYSUC_11010, partial [Planctomycetota bacterium]
MKMTPQSLNACSRGKWVKAHFVLPEGFFAEDVNTNEPIVAEVNNADTQIPADDVNVFVNEAGLVEIEAAFDRVAFSGAAADVNDEYIEVAATGLLANGQSFYGTKTIKILPKSFECVAYFVSRWLEPDCAEPDWCGGFDIDRDSIVNFKDIALFNGCCNETFG